MIKVVQQKDEIIGHFCMYAPKNNHGHGLGEALRWVHLPWQKRCLHHVLPYNLISFKCLDNKNGQELPRTNRSPAIYGLIGDSWILQETAQEEP